jgi:hypothetical protein
VHRLRLTLHSELTQAPASRLSNIFLIPMKGFSFTALKIISRSHNRHLISSTLECAHASASCFTHFSFQQKPCQTSRTQPHSHIIQTHTGFAGFSISRLSHTRMHRHQAHTPENLTISRPSHIITHTWHCYIRASISRLAPAHCVLSHISYLTTLFVQRRSGPLSLMAKHIYSSPVDAATWD